MKGGIECVGEGERWRRRGGGSAINEGNTGTIRQDINVTEEASNRVHMYTRNV